MPRRRLRGEEAASESGLTPTNPVP